MSGRGGEGMVVALVLLGFIALAVWLVIRANTTSEEFPPYTTYSPHEDGLKALYTLLEQTGAKPARFGDTEYDFPAGSCMVLAEGDMPGELVFSSVDVKQLHLWLREGGTLVLLADVRGGTGQALLNELDGVETEEFMGAPLPSYPATGNGAAAQPAVVADADGKGRAGQPTALLQVYQPGCVYKLPQAAPRCFNGVTRIETAAGRGGSELSALALLSADRPPEPVLLYRKVGKGELYWLARPEMLTNDWLARQDNHRFGLNLLSVAAQGRPVQFAEYGHGYARERRGAMALLVQTPGGWLLLTAAALSALLFAGAAVRPARYMPQPPPPRRAAVEMVLAQASLYQRANRQASASAALVDGVRRAYMQAGHSARPPSAAELLAWLEAEPAAPQDPARHLRTYLAAQAEPASAVELLRLAHSCDWARARLERGHKDTP